MAQPLDKIRADALELPAEARADLASALIASLDAEGEDDPADIELAWANELERRLADYDAGRTKGIPASEVFAAARRLFT